MSYNLQCLKITVLSNLDDFVYKVMCVRSAGCTAERAEPGLGRAPAHQLVTASGLCRDYNVE